MFVDDSGINDPFQLGGVSEFSGNTVRKTKTVFYSDFRMTAFPRWILTMYSISVQFVFALKNPTCGHF